MSYNEEGANNNTITDNRHHFMLFVLLIFFYFSLPPLSARWTIHRVSGTRCPQPHAGRSARAHETWTWLQLQRVKAVYFLQRRRGTAYKPRPLHWRVYSHALHKTSAISHTLLGLFILGLYDSLLMWRADVWTGDIIEFYVWTCSITTDNILVYVFVNDNK